MVATKLQNRHPHTPPTAITLPRHRRERHGVGWQIRQPGFSRNLAAIRTEPPLQPKRNAIIRILQGQCHYLQSSILLIQCDNRTVVSCLRNEGGTKSQALVNLAKEVFKILYRYNVYMTTYHLPGNYNTDAGHLSRPKSCPEWHLL